MPPAMAMGGGGCGLLVIALIAMFLGADGGMILRILGQAAQQQVAPPGAQGPGVADDAREFIEVVLRDTEQVWTELFRQQARGTEYIEPRLVIFSGRVNTGCGLASSQVGPFYCPNDQQIYIDPVFFDQLSRRHQAPGDFAQAYVIAHEVAHHVQHLIGFDIPVARARQSGDERTANQASVRLELQADYLAGVWANHADRHYEILEEGDIMEAINAANQIGDDTLMRQSTGFVIPARFTHGTSEQRVRWFRKGLVSGDLNGCQELFELDYSQL
jgi:predicted metalloprotease